MRTAGTRDACHDVFVTLITRELPQNDRTFFDPFSDLLGTRGIWMRRPFS